MADMDALGLRDAVNLGDVFSGPLDAARTADLLMPRDFMTVRGNHDRYLIEQKPADMGPSDRAAFDQLSGSHLEWIKSLPKTTTAFEEKVFLCHATPKSDDDYWLERVEPNGLVRAASLDEVTHDAKGVAQSLILCGHTHIPRVVRLPDGRTVLNPGSVGCPAYDDDTPVYHHMQTGTPNASYAIVEKRETGWDVTFRSVAYDVEKAVACAVRHNRPDWARALATGWFEGGSG